MRSPLMVTRVKITAGNMTSSDQSGDLFTGHSCVIPSWEGYVCTFSSFYLVVCLFVYLNSFLSLKGQSLPLECYIVVILSPLFADSFQLSSYTYLCIISTSFWGCASAWLYLAIVPIWCLVSIHITLFLLKKSKEILW